jgi:CRP/FNR family transcriptional regulator
VNAERFVELRRAAIIDTLRRCELFAGLPLNDLERVAEVCIPKQYDKGDYVFHEGDLSAGFYLVQKGAVNVHRTTPIGREQVIHIFRTGESFAEATMTMEGCPANAQAIESTQLLLVQKAGFLELLRRQPELSLRLFGSLSQRLRLLVGQLDAFKLKDVETRLAHWLLERCPDPASDQPVDIHLAMTKRMLAAELGTVSETFSRTLAKLRKQGLLEVQGRVISLRSPRRLRVLLRQNLGE